MTSPFEARLLADMRPALDQALTPIDRDVVTAAIGQVEDRWSAQKAAQYANALGQRDAQHNGVTNEAKAIRDDAAAMGDQVIHGRLAPAEVRSWLRNAMASHTRLLAQHRGIADSEPHLEALEAMTPDDYQEQQLARMPQLANVAPRLMDVMQAYHVEHAEELGQRLAASQRTARPRYPVSGPMGIRIEQLRGQ